MIVGPDGHVYVFWETGDGTNCSISFSSSADATMYTAAKTISGGSGACNSQPSASVDSTGNIDVTWVADSTNLFFTRSVDGGANFSTPINIATPANPTGDEVIAGPDGGIYVFGRRPVARRSPTRRIRGRRLRRTRRRSESRSMGDLPSFTVDSCGNVTVFGGSGPSTPPTNVRTMAGSHLHQRSTFRGRHIRTSSNRLAIDKSGNVNFTWAVDGPSSVDFARLPTVCHVQ